MQKIMEFSESPEPVFWFQLGAAEREISQPLAMLSQARALVGMLRDQP
jgi:hypothetical protein